MVGDLAPGKLDDEVAKWDSHQSLQRLVTEFTACVNQLPRLTVDYGDTLLGHWRQHERVSKCQDESRQEAQAERDNCREIAVFENSKHASD